MQTKKLFAAAADQNKQDILKVLKTLIDPGADILELGSGTGQHACYLSAQLTGVTWQPTELREKIPVIRQWLESDGGSNIKAPLELDVNEVDWPIRSADVVYTANTLHIISKPAIESLFRGVARLLEHAGFFVAYGPYSFDGEHVSESNAAFDAHLQADDPRAGVRDITWLDELATEHGLAKAVIIKMPVNNCMAVWRRPAIGMGVARH